ncbi:MAG: SpoIIE family protein phosphatase [Planctomycetota bacterium]|nr:SpoIIE family protein phosphatase [Planctomycetota bacterium]
MTDERSRILVVDDSRFMVRFLTWHLERAGYDVSSIDHGDVAMAALREGRPHAVILDHLLPGKNGSEISRLMRGAPDLAHIVQVMVTGQTFSEDSGDAIREAEVDAVFSKPVSPAALLAKLEELGVPPNAAQVAASAVRAESPHFRRALKLLASAIPDDTPLAFALVVRGERIWMGPAEADDLQRVADVEVDGDMGMEAYGRSYDVRTVNLAQGLLKAALEIGIRAGETADLYREIGDTYEGLGTVQGLASDSSLLLEPATVRERLVDAIGSLWPDCGVVLWRIQAETATPVHVHDVELPAERPASVGVVGRVLESGVATVRNAAGPPDPEEPELAGARSVAAVPVVLGSACDSVIVVSSTTRGGFDSQAMGLLKTMAALAALVLEQGRLRDDMLKTQRLRREVEISGTIQSTLLHGNVPAPSASLEVAVRADASRSVAGDFYDLYTYEGGQRVDVLMGDVMGKGIPAALVGAAVKSQFTRFASSEHATGIPLPQATPAQIVSAVHRHVEAELIEVERFATVVFACVDTKTRRLTFVDCGHTPVMRIHARTGEVSELPKPEFEGVVNLALGMDLGTQFEEVAVPFEPGDRFVFYSDGVTEAADEAGEQFGEDRLRDVLAARPDASADELADAVRDAALAFAADGDPGDDLTVIVIETKAVAAELNGAQNGNGVQVLELAAERGQLAEARAFLRRVCGNGHGHHFSEETLAELELALTEAVSNVVRHAYAPEQRGRMRLESRWSDAGLHIRLVNWGTPFDGVSPRPPVELEAAEGGLGLGIIRRVMDEVSYTRGEGGSNCLDLLKRVEGGR